MRKAAPIALELNGIAKGYGVDRLAETLLDHGIADGLVGINGEMRATGPRAGLRAVDHRGGSAGHGAQDPPSILALQGASVATSGDYRHRVEVQGRRLSHTMDPRCGAPLITPPASVTIVASSCAEADARATALMVLGLDKGAALARKQGLDALFHLRDYEGSARGVGVGQLFSEEPAAMTPAEGR